jgi:hypothetical protein
MFFVDYINLDIIWLLLCFAWLFSSELYRKPLPVQAQNHAVGVFGKQWKIGVSEDGFHSPVRVKTI